jgi:hypothetical protein
MLREHATHSEEVPGGGVTPGASVSLAWARLIRSANKGPRLREPRCLRLMKRILSVVPAAHKRAGERHSRAGTTDRIH